MDREKVIKGLECLTQMTSCVGCPYWDSGRTREECLSHIGKDAISLLKEQEMVKPVKQIEQTEWTVCGNCRNHIISKWTFCPYCGMKVKWE